MPRLTSIYDWKLVVIELRCERRLNCTQEMLARKIKASVFSVSKWERGETAPTLKFRHKLARLAEDIGYGQTTWPVVSRGLTVVQKQR